MIHQTKRKNKNCCNCCFEGSLWEQKEIIKAEWMAFVQWKVFLIMCRFYTVIEGEIFVELMKATEFLELRSYLSNFKGNSNWIPTFLSKETLNFTLNRKKTCVQHNLDVKLLLAMSKVIQKDDERKSYKIDNPRISLRFIKESLLRRTFLAGWFMRKSKTKIILIFFLYLL